MRTMKNFLRRLGRLFAVFVVVTTAILAGLFLTACRKMQPEKPSAPPPPDKPAQAPAKMPKAATTEEPQPPKEKSPADNAPASKKKIDLKEIEQGQPIPRNMLE